MVLPKDPQEGFRAVLREQGVDGSHRPRVRCHLPQCAHDDRTRQALSGPNAAPDHGHPPARPPTRSVRRDAQRPVTDPSS
eukprot:9366587-Alexandrium_andersonii.AAC.1